MSGTLFTIFSQKRVSHLVGTQQISVEWMHAVCIQISSLQLPGLTKDLDRDMKQKDTLVRFQEEKLM